ncbi:mechanosensitive ion channel family protein [Phycisphaera mikurensis]|uniref:Putative MscS family protein n=1 Tax=Phycisphaera mikurensis (strain NBRC 102666 / KCTC 22515 / FYK2301M01) TaxID=1142394 RepID=I0IBL6_PHYMF|nr:mechanosensitive ion channel family protein [Phycisphaera mikurensis]MBB6442817.1 small-conductance mechanosensitive channel [Phycisphaera mikurensis]BAM02654.1 putative MscS family protein [Phycisphaera mikurensis NBRC 102666]
MPQNAFSRSPEPEAHAATDAATVVEGVSSELIEHAGTVSHAAERWAREAVSSVPEVLSTLVILAAATFGYRLASRGIAAMVQRTHLDESVGVTLRTFLRWVTVVLVLAAVAARWGVLENFWAAIVGAVTLVAIGFFAVWSVLSNVLCSLILLANRPFRVGDEIELPPDPIRGRVLAVNLTHTTLLDGEGATFQVPNNLFFQRVFKRHPRGGSGRRAAAAAAADPAAAAADPAGEPPADV